MTTFILGQLCTAVGGFQRVGALGQPDPGTLPANHYLRRQPQAPIRFQHSWDIGAVGYYERGASLGLLVAGVVDDDFDIGEEPWFLSGSGNAVEVAPLQWGRARVDEVSLVRRPAAKGTRRVVFGREDHGDPDGSGQPWSLPNHWRESWVRAHGVMFGTRYATVRRREFLPIVDLDQLTDVEEALTDPEAARREAVAEAERLTRSFLDPPSPAVRARQAAESGRVFKHHYPGAEVLGVRHPPDKA